MSTPARSTKLDGHISPVSTYQYQQRSVSIPAQVRDSTKAWLLFFALSLSARLRGFTTDLPRAQQCGVPYVAGLCRLCSWSEEWVGARAKYWTFSGSLLHACRIMRVFGCMKKTREKNCIITERYSDSGHRRPQRSALPHANLRSDSPYRRTSPYVASWI